MEQHAAIHGHAQDKTSDEREDHDQRGDKPTVGG